MSEIQEEVVVVETPKKRKGKSWLYVLVGVVGLAVVGWFGFDYFLVEQPVGDCDIAVVDEAVIAMVRSNEEFFDTLMVADVTGRANLAVPLLTLQSAHRGLEYMEVPVCLERTQTLYSLAMDQAINGYLAFMDSDTPDEEVSEYFDKYVDYLLDGNTEKERVLQCYPECD